MVCTYLLACVCVRRYRLEDIKKMRKGKENKTCERAQRKCRRDNDFSLCVIKQAMAPIFVTQASMSRRKVPRVEDFAGFETCPIDPSQAATATTALATARSPRPHHVAEGTVLP